MIRAQRTCLCINFTGSPIVALHNMQRCLEDAGSCKRPSNNMVQHLPTPGRLVRADHILGLAMSVFRTDSVLLHLRDGDQVFARGGNEIFSPGIRAATCRLLEPAQRGISVVEDFPADPRSAPACCCQKKFSRTSEQSDCPLSQ